MAVEARAVRADRALLAGSVALFSLIAFEYMAVATAMPTVAQALDGQAWYALAFGGALAAGVVGKVVSGDWSDRRGPGASMWVGVGGFAAGLVLAGLAPTMLMLALGRVIQGFGSGLLIVALYVVVGRAVAPDRRPRIFAAFAAAWVVPSIVGPAVAGAIVEYVGWRWVFLGVAPLALPAVALLRPALRRAAQVRPDDGYEERRGSTRQIGWALAVAGGVGLLYYGGQLTGPAGLVSIAVALVGLAATVPRLLPTGTLRARRGLPTVILLRGIAGASFISAEVFIPLMLSRERGFSPTAAGLALTVGALAWSAGSLYQGRLRRTASRARLPRIGMACLAIGVASITIALWPAVPASLAVAGWTAAGLGMGLTFPTLSVLTLELSPAAEQGRNSSALQLWDSLATAMVLAVVGAMFTALLPHSTTGAYLTSFGIAAGLAVLGFAIAARTTLRPSNVAVRDRPITVR